MHVKLKKELSFPHNAYAIPAWGLMVLPGPGGESNDPSEDHCDWMPGLGTTARHFAEFPSYVAEHVPPEYLTNRGMWQRMRDVIGDTSLPGVSSEDRFACWGMTNLTQEHARSESSREQPKKWDLETIWQILEICRPALIIAPPSGTGKARCYLRVQELLTQKGGVESGTMRSYPGDKGARTWDFQWWKTPWGKCRVGKMHTQPSYWGRNVADILSEEAHRIADAA